MNQNYINELGDLIQPFKTLPGIDRDNPIGKIKAHVDGQWCRFDNGNPRKMGGYIAISPGTTQIIRALYTVAVEDFTRVFIFRNTGIWQIDILADGSTTGETNRTPVGWAPPSIGTPDLTFSFDEMTIYDAGADESTTFLFVVAPPNSQQINQTSQAPIFMGQVDDTSPFTSIDQTTSGGVIVYEPFLVKFGNNGVIYWSGLTGGGEPDPLSWPTDNRKAITSKKILAARPFPGGILMWTSSALFRVVYDGTTFVATPVSTEISLLSPASIVAGHNSTYYWFGKNQVYIYNGVSDTIDNILCRNQFFERLNKKYPGKVFGVYVGDFKEIWWFSPQDESTECNHLYVFPYKSNDWSDSVCWRSAGVGESELDKPLFSDSQTNVYSGIPTYSIWMHEVGTDIEVNTIRYPLPSWIQTRQFSILAGNPQMNVEMRISKIEKDMQQIGDMDVQVFTYPYTDSDPYITTEFTFQESTTQMDIQLSGRYISFKYTSNTLGGFYQIGEMKYDYKLGAPSPGGN